MDAFFVAATDTTFYFMRFSSQARRGVWCGQTSSIVNVDVCKFHQYFSAKIFNLSAYHCSINEICTKLKYTVDQHEDAVTIQHCDTHKISIWEHRRYSNYMSCGLTTCFVVRCNLTFQVYVHVMQINWPQLRSSKTFGKNGLLMHKCYA